MRILIDLQGAQSKSRYRGIGRYTLSLAKALIRNRGEHEVFIVLNALLHESIEDMVELFSTLIPHHHIIIFEGVGPVDELTPQNGWRLRASEAMREKFLIDLQPDLVVVSSLFEGTSDNTVASIKSFFPSLPTAVILYDLIPLINPEQYISWEPLKNWYYRKIESLKRADLLLGISESASQEGKTYLGVEHSKIITISSAADEMFDNVSIDPLEIQSVLERYAITRPYLMHSSAYDPRKNFEGLIEAFAALPISLRSRFQLVLVCRLDDHARQKLLRFAANLSLAPEDMILTGHILDSELIPLYAAAHLFVFPSLHEGFGLPILEAMACGTPVIGSNTSSVPEVIGRSDALFDPHSIPDITRMIEKALTDQPFYDELCEHAALQYKRFSWDQTAITAWRSFENLDPSPTYPDSKTRYETLIRSIGLIDFPSTEEDWIAAAVSIDKNEKTAARTLLYTNRSDSLNWRIEGPFDSSYSLALLNRETARALEAMGHTVILHSTEGPGDFAPNPRFLEENPDLARMHERVPHYPHESVDVASRNLYPPRVRDMNAPLNLLHHYAWEESAFPPEWVSDFNASLQGITCLSDHVQKILIDAGVDIPMTTSGCGVDHWQRVLPDPDFPLEAKSFRFLHVSSCFPRKGVEDLLEAYGKAFTIFDDVTLVIKTFKNPHNELESWLRSARSRFVAYPDVAVIEADITDSALKALYTKCHALVSPSRAEGYGLPMAEAMLSDLPVITTGWGGQLDFCDDQNSYLVDYTFEKAQTHFNLFNSVWAKVDVDDLASIMRRVYETPESERKAKAALGAQHLLRDHTWHMASSRLESFVNTLRTDPPRTKKEKIGWISTYNTKCGIATYSEHLIHGMKTDTITLLAPFADETLTPDPTNLIRCWHSAKEQNRFDTLSETIDAASIDTLVIQFNYGFFHFADFSRFLHAQIDAGRTVILMMHATTDPFGDTPNWRLSELMDVFRRVDRILVHAMSDLNRLKTYRLIDNVALFPHGILTPSLTPSPKTDDLPLVATYGFALPHKGLPELLYALRILLDTNRPIRLRFVTAQYPDPVSERQIAELHTLIQTLSLSEYVELHTDFLTDEQSFSLLSPADLLVFAYQHTGESASGAVRYAIATAKPVALTPLSIFDDVRDVGYTLPGIDPEAIASGISSILSEIASDSQHSHAVADRAAKWREAHSYDTLGERLLRMIRALRRFDH